MLKYLSVCSGVEAATLAWKPLGWKAVGFAEIEPFPSAVLAYHYPEVNNFGDFTKIRKDDVGEFDLLVGGTPCQDFSVAGKREGWEGKRGSLTYEYVRLLSRTMPTWFVWENVQGVYTGKHTGGFFEFLKAIKELGYDVGYRTLDAEFVRVPGFERAIPQRRKRVFVVGSLRRECVRGVLFEPETCCGDIETSKEEEQGYSSKAQVSTYRMREFGDYVEDKVASTIKARDYKDATDLICVHGSQDPICNTEVANCIGRNRGLENVIAISGNILGRKEANGGNQVGFDASGACYTLTTSDRHAVCYGTIIRRLTPLENERLMGFPDNYTRIPWDGKPAEECPSELRYKACGNSMCVNVMRWLGMRIESTKGKV